MPRHTPLLLFGAGPYARHLRRIAADAGRVVMGFVVDAAHLRADTFEGLPLTDWETLSKSSKLGDVECVVAVGYRSMRARSNVAARIAGAGGRLGTLVHPGAHVAASASIGAGSILFPGSIVEHFVELGENNVLWSGATVCHETRLGRDNYLAPGVIVSGNCRVGARCFFGVRSALVDGIEVGDDCLVGAAALLTQCAEPLGHYVGVPATRRRAISADAGVCVGG